LVWLKFIVCAAIIVVAGTKAAQYGNIIAERTGLGRIRVGFLLLAVISSMPELITGISSVAIVNQTDFGVGTLLGSCLFNLTIIAILDIVYRRGPVLNQVSLRHLPLAGMGILLMAVAGLSIRFRANLSGMSLGWLGVPTMVIMLLYLLGLWRILRSEAGYQASLPDVVTVGLARRVWVKLAVAALAVVGGGIWISYIADEIALVTGWEASFIGSLFLAIVTSMPELVIAIAAFRMGALDLAVADILGANMLDISYLFILDLFYARGSLLTSVSGANAITAVAVIAMTFVIAVGLRFRQRRKTFFVISWYGVVLIALYIYGAYALYNSGIG
jgi:cation:H+ antiporter